MNKISLIEAVLNYSSSNRRNSMGCSEDWYNFIYAMNQTFTINEIENMSEREIELLEKLHDNVSDGLY